MKKTLSFLAVAALSLTSISTFAQAAEDKSKRPSPPVEVSATLASGAAITINYSQPSVKGRTIGKDLEPYNGKVWRTGANEATTIKTDKDIKINGAALPAGKYSLFTIADDKEWTVIFNKVAEQWGAYKYDEKEDALRIKAKASKATQPSEKLAFTVSKSGEVNIFWGDNKVEFTIQ